MRLMKFPMMASLALCLTAGSCPRPEPQVAAPTEAAFCDVEEPRRFSQAELTWRAEHAPWNLRRDYKTNLTWERECEDGEPEEAAD